MTTSQRDIRPFAAVSALEDLLETAVLRVGGDSIEAGGRRILEEDVFLNSHVWLSIGSADRVSFALEAASQDLGQLDLSIDDLEFAVFLNSGYLRISEVRHRVRLADLAAKGPDLVLSTPPRPAALRSPRAGCTVEACVLLAVERQRRPLKPWRRGSWLSRRTWELTTQHAFTGFTPLPLTAEKKAELHLGSRTVRYVTLDGVSPIENGVGEDAVQVWLDSELMAKMSANPKSAVSIALQYQLFLDAVRAVVREACATDDFDRSTWDEVGNSILGRIVTMILPPAAGEAARLVMCATYLDMIKEDPEKFMSHVEDAVGLGQALEAGLDG